MEDEPFSPQAAYQLIKDELALDGTPGLNLGACDMEIGCVSGGGIMGLCD